MSRADRALIYAIGGVAGLLAGLGAGALVVGEPAPRVCLSCHGEAAPADAAVPTLAAVPTSSRPPARPARPSVALTHPAGQSAPRATPAPAQPAQEASTSAAPTSATAAPTSTETPPTGPSAAPDPPTSPVEPDGVSTSGLLTSGEPPP